MIEVERLTVKALRAAQKGDWQEAVDLNKEILSSENDNLAALNRLAKAYIELNKPEDAEEVYQKVLKIDNYNSIALKNLKKLENFSQSSGVSNKGSGIVNFIEEPGITTSIYLINVGEPKVLATVDPGDEVRLVIRKRFICVTTDETDLHLGKLPEDLSLRLITLIRAGNSYQAWVKSLKDVEIEIFLREIFRSPQYQSIPSFPEGNHSAYLAFTDPSAIYGDRPDTTSTDEQD